MPADLPGLYFDVEKNRYFPISSRPPVPSSSSSASLHLPSKPAPHPGRRKFSGLADYTSAAQRSRHTQCALPISKVTLENAYSLFSAQ